MAPLNTHPAQPVDESVDSEGLMPSRHTRHGAHRRIGLRSAPSSRVAYALGVATVCSLALVNLLSGEPAANATDSPSVAVAAALGIDGSGIDAPAMEEPQLLEQLAASRSERDAEQAAAAAPPAPHNMERIIDDVVLLTFLVSRAFFRVFIGFSV